MPGPLSTLGVAPPSNLMTLPPLGGMTFSITTNGGWYDIINFPQPGSTLPIDLTGIDFHAELRRTIGDANVILDLSTKNAPPNFINGRETGNLFFSADASLFSKITPGVYVMDMLAIDIVTSMVRNLCELSPILVTINQGITR